MIEDVVIRPGKRAINLLLPKLREPSDINLVVANGENVVGGFSITIETTNELLSSGVDVITSGTRKT